MNKLNKYFQQLSPRERVLVTVGGAILISCLCYYVVWLPWQQREEQWLKIIASEKGTVEWMKRQVPNLQIKRDRIQQEQGEVPSLSAMVTDSSLSYGLVISRLQPQGEQLSVTLAPGEFNSLMQWLTYLERQYHIHIVVFDVTAQDSNPGVVVVNRLLLTRNKVGGLFKEN
ncbi:type II secretion system protein GspM [Providencia alcalifaciens]|uniref:type II secretion system protein GspM n=1 Tax=Providencia alcalifaciens TaxID=126385 RepID=UPI001CC74A40|nr:type II secretion system protein M [Providencia alcalifaciens]CAG9435353.1 Type II secretion system protein M [Providencia alcalifaciens]CAG9435692.1 Type II secretion system protein M [Providencia alcalifaciens]CAG9435710.1 Type II secretion system protein M [Providencia alcalifaciens]CAG9435713.1 Type II secretion system protein M [Providencia alcalifaciens]CAG9435976.1 Type II secretion system protein M [Providencia alcalifaciens]